MANTKSQHDKIPSSQDTSMIDVLCQKMGDRWYAFSLIDDEVFIGSLTDEEVSRVTEKGARIEKTNHS